MAYDKVVYTAIFGGYDTLLPVNKNWQADFICFTDNTNLSADGWRINVIQEDSPPNILNRRYKMLPHLYFKIMRKAYTLMAI